MKKLLIYFGIILVVPLVAGAAYNDVTLTQDVVVINVAGINLDITGTDAVIQSVTVNANDFSFVLVDGSEIQITSTDRRVLDSVSESSADYHSGQSCDSSKSVTTFTPISGAANTITVTPSASTCTVPTSTSSNTSGSSSGSGGGGGGTTLPTTPATPTPALQALASAAPQAVFNRSLSLGSAGDDVKTLQTKLTSEGVYSGPITGYFGSLTQAGVKAYQAKYGIDQLGIVGPATRAQLNKGSAKTEVTAGGGSLTPAQVSVIMAQINVLLKQVQELQAKLKALGN